MTPTERAWKALPLRFYGICGKCGESEYVAGKTRRKVQCKTCYTGKAKEEHGK